MSHLQAGNRLMVSKRYEEAVKEFLAHAEECPAEAPRAYVQAGECLRRTNTLKKPVTIEPGVSLVSVGDSAGAIDMYRRALAVEPAYFPALLGLAQALPIDSDEQVQALKGAVAIRRDPLAVQLLGECFVRTGRKALAASLYRDALAERPDDRHLRDTS